MKAPFLTLTAALALAGCATVGPDYKAPTIALPKAYVGGSGKTAGQTAGHVATQAWWRDYRDPVLDGLVAKGLAQNLSIKTAIEKVAQAQATLRTTGAAGLVSGGVTASSTQTGGDAIPTTTTDAAKFTPALILDLFGAEAQTRAQALAQLQATRLSVGEARLAFLSSVATNYINARYYQSAMAITRTTIASRRETLRIVRDQLNAGTGTQLDVAQAEAALAQTRATMPSLETGYYGAVFALATLVGEPAAPLLKTMNRGAAQPWPRVRAGVGVPADLLHNRPDVRAAERSYAAAVAGVGIAEAAFYPSIALGGTITQASSKSWSFGPSISLPILNQGALHAARDAKVSAAKQAELAWRSSVLSAVQNVQSAQIAYSRSQSAVARAREAVSAYQRVVSLSRETYQAGTTTLIDLLTNERALASAQLSLASARQSLAANWAALQVAVGRGWDIGGK